jgi:hypothetical protein
MSQSCTFLSSMLHSQSLIIALSPESAFFVRSKYANGNLGS